MDPHQKLRIALASYAKKKTVKKIARANGISRKVIYDWRKDIERAAPLIFSRGGGMKKIHQLNHEVKSLLAENEDLKTALHRCDPNNPLLFDEDDGQI